MERWEYHQTPPTEGDIESWWCLEKRNSHLFNDVDFVGSTTHNGVALQSWIYVFKKLGHEISKSRCVSRGSVVRWEKENKVRKKFHTWNNLL